MKRHHCYTTPLKEAFNWNDSSTDSEVHSIVIIMDDRQGDLQADMVLELRLLYLAGTVSGYLFSLYEYVPL